MLHSTSTKAQALLQPIRVKIPISATFLGKVPIWACFVQPWGTVHFDFIAFLVLGRRPKPKNAIKSKCAVPQGWKMQKMRFSHVKKTVHLLGFWPKGALYMQFCWQLYGQIIFCNFSMKSTFLTSCCLSYGDSSGATWHVQATPAHRSNHN